MSGDGSGVGDLFDVLCEALFWFLLALVGCTAVWRLLDGMRAPEPAEPAEPDEWDKLPEEEKVLLKRFFK